MRFLFTVLTLMATIASMAQSYTTDEYGHTVASLPYQTSFDNTYNEYDGSSFLPIGWMCSGDNPFYTASTKDIEAADGTYYAISVNNSATLRNDRLYTPFFLMEAGQTYTLSFKLWMPGLTSDFVASDGFGDKEFRMPKFRATVGEEQDYDFHTTELATLTTPTNGWQDMRINYTPSTSGTYCFCMAFDADLTYTGDVAIDDLMVLAGNSVLRPTASFSYDGLFNLMNGSLITMEGGYVHFTSTSTNATNYEWTVTDEDGKKVATSEEENPSLYLGSDGYFTVTLRAYNEKFEATTKQSFLSTCVHPGEPLWAPLQTYSENTSTFTKADETPCLLPDVYDFITGPNHYYRRFAERVELPSNAKFTINTFNYWLLSCTLASVTSGTVEGNKTFRFAIYGEKDGKPDENNVMWSQTMPMNKAFTTNVAGLGGGTPMTLAMTAEVEGPFYMAFEYPEDLTLDSPGNRTFIEVMTNRHHSGVSSLYYYSEALNEWHKIDDMNPKLAGFGMQYIFWGTLNVGTPPEGINNANGNHNTDQRCIDLGGRTLSQPSFGGIYIQNGRKILAR